MESILNESIVISIIVPVYNCEKYIGECIESVLEQTYPGWELIIVDDGSVDKTPEIIDGYKNIDNRITTIHKKNGGEFSSRLEGLKVANGDFITGIDADDKITKDYLEQIVLKIEKTNADCIICAYQEFGDTNSNDVFSMVEPNTKLDTEQLLYEVLSTSTPSFWCKTIRSDCFNISDYLNVPNVRMAEDYLMIIPALCNVKTAYCINSAVYQYRIHSESASFKYNTKVIEDLGLVSLFGLEILNEKKLLNKEIESAIYLDYIRSIAHRIWYMAYDGTLRNAEFTNIIKSQIYCNSEEYERYDSLPLLIYVIMKLFRKKRFRLLRLLARIRIK